MQSRKVHKAIQAAVTRINSMKDSERFADEHWDLAEELGAAFVQQLRHIAKVAKCNRKERDKFFRKAMKPFNKMLYKP